MATFRKIDILKAFAIVHIFETSKPLGDPSTVAVLDDGAGLSVGISQFTHKSGSLKKVCTEYLELGGTVGAEIIRDRLPNLANPKFITKYSKDNQLKDALRRAGKADLMREAQENIAIRHYMQPAINACEGSGFVLPMSLAVVYDSMNHGSYGKIRDRVSASDKNEKAWISEYVKDRDAWLEGVPRLAKTDYRTDFFLAQIARDNWNLNFPLNVHGYRLTADDLPEVGEVMTGSTGSDDPRNGPNVAPELVEDELGGDHDTEQTDEQASHEGFDGDKAASTTEQAGADPLGPEIIPGDTPEAPPKRWLNVEDWKPFVLRWLGRAWTSFGTLNTAQAAGLVSAAVADPPRWFIYLAIAAGIFVLTVVAALVVTVIMLAIWYVNRKEIVHYKTLEQETATDPAKYNLGLKFVKQ